MHDLIERLILLQVRGLSEKSQYRRNNKSRERGKPYIFTMSFFVSFLIHYSSTFSTLKLISSKKKDDYAKIRRQQ